MGQGHFWPKTECDIMWAETGGDGSVRGVRAGKRKPETNRGHPEGSQGPKPAKRLSSIFLVLSFSSWWGLAARKKLLIKVAKYDFSRERRAKGSRCLRLQPGPGRSPRTHPLRIRYASDPWKMSTLSAFCPLLSNSYRSPIEFIEFLSNFYRMEGMRRP